MRTALLAALKPTATGDLRANLVLAGRTVLARQVGLALALGCERVIVLTDGQGPALGEAERACRDAGALFQSLPRFSSLATLIRGEDELVVLADGLLPDKAPLRALIAPDDGPAMLRRVVLCLPDDDPQAVKFPEDFERIDAARWWAGVTVMRGVPVQQLADFPPDSDAISLLLRLALQAGTPCHTLSPEDRAAPGWLLAHHPEAVSVREAALVRQHAVAASDEAPFAQAAAWLAGRMIGQIGAGRAALAERALVVLGIATLVTACLSGVWNAAALAAMLATGGVLMLGMGAAMGRLAGTLMGTKALLSNKHRYEQLRDGAIALVLALAIFAPGAPLALAALGPIALATLHLAERAAPPGVAVWWKERAGQLGLAALAAATGALAEACALLALGALGQALFTGRRQAIPE
jgi:hypothetical protein